MMRRDVGGDRQMHRERVGAGLRLERHEPVRAYQEHQRREGSALAALGKRDVPDLRGETQQCAPGAARVEKQRDGQDDGPDQRVMHWQAGRPCHRKHVERRAQENGARRARAANQFRPQGPARKQKETGGQETGGRRDRGPEQRQRRRSGGEDPRRQQQNRQRGFRNRQA